jgi:hypothetical protein
MCGLLVEEEAAAEVEEEEEEEPLSLSLSQPMVVLLCLVMRKLLEWCVFESVDVLVALTSIDIEIRCDFYGNER